MEENRPVRKASKFPIICLAVLGLIFAEATAMLVLQVVKATNTKGQGGSSGGETPTPAPTQDPTYTITWLNDDGTVLEVDQDVAQGETPTYDGVAPTKLSVGLTYYTFAGWNHEVVAAVANTTYVATYSIGHNKATVIFDMGGHGDQVDSQSVEYNGHVTKPTDPTSDEYTFYGWYTEPSCTIVWNFETDKVTTDITLYAKWEKTIFYTVSFDNEYGDPIPSQTIAAGGKITNPGEPANLPDNIHFNSWIYDDGHSYIEWLFDTMVVTSDMTLIMYYSEAI